MFLKFLLISFQMKDNDVIMICAGVRDHLFYRQSIEIWTVYTGVLLGPDSRGK